jgi:hypothetical protein
VPKQIVHERNLDSNRIAPNFCDREELGASTDLSEAIRQALKDSECGDLRFHELISDYFALMGRAP